jgi:hypothetical protein
VFNQLPKAGRKFRSRKVVYMNVHPIWCSLEDLTEACSRIVIFWGVTLYGWVIGSRTLNPWTWRRHVPSKRRDLLNRRHSVTSQEIRILDMRWSSKGKVGSDIEGWYHVVICCQLCYSSPVNAFMTEATYSLFVFPFLFVKALKHQLHGRQFHTYTSIYIYIYIA